MRKRGGARTNWGMGGVVLFYLLTLLFLCSMSSKSPEEIDSLVKNLDRLKLLAFLGVEDLPEPVGDNECLRPVSASTINRFTVHKDNVPFLGKIGGGICGGATVRRYGRSSIGVPCFVNLEDDAKFCDVCKEIFEEHDENGFYVMDTETMPKSKEFYKPAKAAVLWNLPFMRRLDHFFSDQVQAVKDVLHGTEAELERDWPYSSFRQVSTEILLNSGVLHHDADKSKNCYKRDQWEHDRLDEFMKQMIDCWVRISAVIDTEDLLTEIQYLQKTAKSVAVAATWSVQQQNPSIPIWCGPLVPADIMLAGFRAAAKSYQIMLNNVNAELETDKIEQEEVSWGGEVDALHEWAKSVVRVKRPQLKSKKYSSSSQEPPRTPAKQKQKSPASVRRWYAAKGTTRPGAYAFKHVAESYNRQGLGTIKTFRSLAQVREWLDMPSPRLFMEREVNPAPLPDAQQPSQEEIDEPESGEEFFVIKGGKDDGIFKELAQAVKAKSRGGGALAMFSSRREAEVYLRPAEAFVVWAGRQVGIMSKSQCIQATQKLTSAKLCGPLSQDEAKKKWKEVKTKSKVIGEAAPTTPVKTKNKKSRTPKKKYFYAVAIGKVPGVYDSWQEAEQQVKNVRPNLHSKFTTRAQAQKFVDERGDRKQTTTAEEDDQEEEKDENEDDQGTSSLKIEIPTMQELQDAENADQVRVFACHTGVGTARIALSLDKAIEGVQNPAVQVVNAKSSLVDNLAEAEVRLKKDKQHARKSISDRLAEARARAGASSHARKEATGPIKPAPRKKGQSVGAFGGLAAVGRAKEVKMITFHFLGDFAPIELNYDQVPFLHELDEEMELPDTKATFNPAANFKDVTIKDFFNAKEKAMPTWSLMGFRKFMAFCRRARRLCQASTKESAAVNAAAIDVLMDVGIQTYSTMERMGELGVDDIRFKTRMYMHLQHMCTYRIMHASAIAMTVFSDATDAFVARLPNQSKFKTERYNSSSKPQTDRSSRTPADKTKPPVSGCYLCAATDHYSNDTRFHPLLPDGTREKLSSETKQAILERINKSDLSAAVKATERDNVRRYWSQHSL